MVGAAGTDEFVEHRVWGLDQAAGLISPPPVPRFVGVGRQCGCHLSPGKQE